MSQGTERQESKKKNQHYVPRMYLRNFAQGEKKSIALYNLKSKKVVLCAPIKHQCSASYFYGRDLRIENSLQGMEGLIAQLIDKIISSNAIPKRTSSDHSHLIFFTLLQYARTQQAAKAHNDAADKFLKAFLEKEGTFSKDVLDLLRIELSNPIQMSLNSAAQTFHLLLDLKMKVLINSTDVEFITSDHPVVFYNQYLEGSLPHLGGNTGLACKGLQIFLPLSPKHLLVLYDETVYRVGNRRSDSCTITNPNDVHQLNDLQYLNCLENLYACGGFSVSDTFTLEQRNAKRKRSTEADLNQYEQGGRHDGRSAIFLHLIKTDHRIKLSIHAIHQLTRPHESELNAFPRPVRNPKLVRAFQKFEALVKANKYQPGDFRRYIKDTIESHLISETPIIPLANLPTFSS